MKTILKQLMRLLMNWIFMIFRLNVNLYWILRGGRATGDAVNFLDYVTLNLDYDYDDNYLY